MTQTERVRTGRDRQHGSLLHPDRVADRTHLEGIGHDESAIPQIHAKKVVQDRAVHRRRSLANRPNDDVGGHDRPHPCFDCAPKRDERVLLERLDDRKLEVRVLGGVTVPGEVLRARSDTGTLQPTHGRRDVPGDELCIRAERANPDDRIEGVRVDVSDGSEVEVHPNLSEIGRERRRDLLGQDDVVDRSERRVSRIRAACRSLEPGHVASLFVDRDQEVWSLGSERCGQSSQLLPILDVPGVEDDATEPFREPSPKPVGCNRPLESREDASRSEPLELSSLSHPFTAPAVSPNAIFR